MIPDWGWLLFAYVVGTAFGFYAKDVSMQAVIGATIDSLVDNGYLKHRKDTNGDIEILKWNQDDDGR